MDCKNCYLCNKRHKVYITEEIDKELFENGFTFDDTHIYYETNGMSFMLFPMPSERVVVGSVCDKLNVEYRIDFKDVTIKVLFDLFDKITESINEIKNKFEKEGFDEI